MLLGDGNLATEWLLARYLDRLTEQEADLIRAYYLLNGSLTTRELAEKHHLSGAVVLERRHTAVRRLWRLIAWEFDEPEARHTQESVADAVERVVDLTDDDVTGSGRVRSELRRVDRGPEADRPVG